LAPGGRRGRDRGRLGVPPLKPTSGRPPPRGLRGKPARRERTGRSFGMEGTIQ